MALKDAQAAKDVSAYFWQEVAEIGRWRNQSFEGYFGVANAELAALRDSVERLSRLLKQAHETTKFTKTLFSSWWKKTMDGKNRLVAMLLSAVGLILS